jgi:diguanylate cyclase (GGDEF)-like protein/PAS domain S-box-containing protein
MPDTIMASSRTLHGEEPFATHADPVMIFDAQRGRCLEANAAAIRSYGYSRAEFVGLTAEALAAPGHLTTVAGAGTGRATSTTAHRRRDGSQLDVDETVLDFEWDGVPVSVLFAADVTKRVRTELELREAVKTHERLHRMMDLGHWWVDLATGRTTWSDELFALARIPVPADSSPGDGEVPVRCHAHPDDQERILEDLRAVRKTGRVHRTEYRVGGDEAPLRWVEMLTAREDDAAGNPLRIVGTIVDITARKIAHDLLEYSARRDLLTGLANRGQLHKWLSAVCSAAKGDSKAAVLFLGLDDFKRINDTLGHATGDSVLKMAAVRLQTLTRDADLVARSGSDEFAIVLGDCTAADAAAAACRLIDSFAVPLRVGSRAISVGVTIGIVCYSKDGTDADSLLRNADTAMYHAKRSDRGSYRFFEESMHAAAVRRFTLESGLRRALQRGGLLVHYQPVVTIDGRIIGSEALVRWPRNGRLISAAEFIPVAEDTGLINQLDSFVLAEACRQNALWQRSGRRLRIAVNVSAHSIARPDFTESVRAELHDSGLDPALLELELTESALQADLVETARKVADVRALGVGVALDDFGTGYNSLSVLRTCGFDTLKLDRTFVSDIVTNHADSVIAEAVIVAAHRLGARVVAEGVETEQQRAALADLHCDDAQGYLFGAALSPADFERLIGAPILPGTLGRVA